MRDDRLLARGSKLNIRTRNQLNPHRVAAIFAGLIFSAPAFAYIGPGAGLSAIGSVLALVGAVLLMIVGFVWYPVKRALARRKQASLPPESVDELLDVEASQEVSDDSIKVSGQG